MLPHSDTLSRFRATSLCPFSVMMRAGGEATTVNVVVFGLIRSGLDLTIYRTRGELTNHYAIDVSNRDTDIQYINVLKGITDKHLYFTCKSENEKRLSIVSCKFKTNTVCQIICTIIPQAMLL